jgi:hypothetical protein
MTSTLRVHDRAASSGAQGYGYGISGGECFHSFQLCLLPVGTTCVIHIVWSKTFQRESHTIHLQAEIVTPLAANTATSAKQRW